MIIGPVAEHPLSNQQFECKNIFDINILLEKYVALRFY